MKYFILATSLISLSLVTTTKAELVDVTLKGTLAHTFSYDITRDSLSAVQREYIDSFDIGSTFEFTFRYDSDSQPTSTAPYPLSPIDERAIYTTGVSLRSGRVGTFTDFHDWQLALTLSTFWIYGGYDAVQFELTDPNSARVVDLRFNWNVIGGVNGRDVFTPNILPDAKALDGIVQGYHAFFGIRYTDSQQLIYQKGLEDIKRISAVTVVPEPTSATLFLSLLVTAIRWRRRM